MTRAVVSCGYLKNTHFSSSVKCHYMLTQKCW